jgi:hypothetical protein
VALECWTHHSSVSSSPLQQRELHHLLNLPSEYPDSISSNPATMTAIPSENVMLVM